MDELLKKSNLIYKLASKLTINDPNSLRKAVQIFQTKLFSDQYSDTSVYKFRWTNYLQSKNKFSEIQIMNRDIQFLSKSLKFPNLLFHLIDKIRPHQANLLRSPIPKVPKLFPIVRSSIPIDFISVLQGIDGTHFRWSEAQKRYVFYGSVSPNQISIIKQVSNIGCMIRIIRSYISDQNGICHQYSSTVLESLLQTHQNFITNIQQKIDSISGEQFLSLLSSQHINTIKSASIICNTVSKKNGGVLYNTLDRISKHGDPNISYVSTLMKDKCFEFIEILIKEWMTRGEVNDPYSEFFVKCDTSVNLCSRWWRDRFSIITSEVPTNIDANQTQLIFRAGKSLNFLREWDTPIDIHYDIGLSFDDFILKVSEESNRQILNVFLRNNLLVNTFKDIHDFVLLQRGDFANSFMEININNITQHLSGIIQRFSNHLVEEIDIELSDNNWQLVYRTQPPISTIFGQTELSEYKLISGILLRLKKVEHMIVNTEKSNRTYSLVFFEMLQFIRFIQEYFHLQVIKKSYEKTLNVFMNPKNLDEILSVHTKHLNIISRGCWITQSGKECRQTLFRILDGIERTINSPFELKENVEEFHMLLIMLRDKILEHKTTGKELSVPLVRMFQRVFDTAENYV